MKKTPKTIEKINEEVSWFSEKFNTIGKLLEG